MSFLSSIHRNIAFSLLALSSATAATSVHQSPDTVHVLSIDGGGIRGLLATNILLEIESRTQKPLSELFDVIAGTSTGGLIALGLVTPDDQGRPKYNCSDLLKIYSEKGGQIFEQTMSRQITTLNGLGKNKYTSDGINSLLHDYFGNTTLSQAITPVMVTSYNIHDARPYFFRSDKAKKSLRDDHYMVQAGRATSAAPTYFSPAHFSARDGKLYSLIDGGIVANNPTLDALLWAKILHPEAKNFLVMSVGTGDLRKGLSYSQMSSQGGLGWLDNILNVMWDGTNMLTDERLQDLLNKNGQGPHWYYRFQWPIPEEHGAMDDTSPRNIEALQRLSKDAINVFQRDLDELSQKLLERFAPPVSPISAAETTLLNTTEELQDPQEPQQPIQVTPPPASTRTPWGDDMNGQENFLN